MRGARETIWLGALLAPALLASLAFACAAPLVAVATAAALTLRRKTAVVVACGAWAIEQAAGFGIHHFPLRFGTLADGAALGAASVLATLAVSFVPLGLSRGSRVRAGLAAFVVAFATFELALVPVAAMLGELGAFRISIDVEIFANDALWALGLLVARNVVFNRASLPARAARAMSSQR